MDPADILSGLIKKPFIDFFKRIDALEKQMERLAKQASNLGAKPDGRRGPRVASVEAKPTRARKSAVEVADDDTMTVAETVTALGVGEQTVRRLLRDAVILGVPGRGRRGWRVSRSSVEAYAATRGVDAFKDALGGDVAIPVSGPLEALDLNVRRRGRARTRKATADQQIIDDAQDEVRPEDLAPRRRTRTRKAKAPEQTELVATATIADPDIYVEPPVDIEEPQPVGALNGDYPDF